MDHLNGPLMDALLRGDPPAVSHFRAHLASPCDLCEAYLLEAPLSSLEALADLHLLRPLLDEVDDSGFAQLRRRLNSRRRLGLGAALAVAAAAALALVVAPARPESDEGLKGGAALTLEVSAALSAPDGAVVRVDPSSTLPPRGILLLRYHASEPATARVYRHRAADGTQTLLGQVDLRAGSHELSTGISLEGEAGHTTFRLEATSERGRTANVDLTFDIAKE